MADPAIETASILRRVVSTEDHETFQLEQPVEQIDMVEIRQLEVVGTPATLRPSEQAPVLLPEGQVLNVSSIAGTVGRVLRLDPAGGATVLQSWAVGAFALAPIGPYAGQQRFLMTCSAGSVVASAANAVLAARPPSQLQESNFLYEGGPGGYFAAPVAVGANPYSELMQFTLPTDCDSAQVTLFNADSSPVTGVKVSIGYGSTLGAANGTMGLAANGLPIGGAFTKCTQNGIATGALSAAGSVSTGPSGVNIGGSDCGFETFDLTFCPTVSRVDGNDRDKPVGYIIVTWPPGSKRTFLELDGSSSVGWQNEGSQSGRIAPYGHPHRVTAATFTATAIPSTDMVRFALRGAGGPGTGIHSLEERLHHVQYQKICSRRNQHIAPEGR